MAKQELEKKQEKVRRTSNQTGKKEDEEKEADEGECWVKNEQRLDCLSRPVCGVITSQHAGHHSN